ncbi:MAG: hypothetical protein FWD59_08995 [Micrococcales bacterium]|nr:hypothetical protein [Micrococcales bacterium]
MGGPVSIPGDESWRTLHVVNSSDCAGLVTVEAYDVLAEVPPDSVNDILPEIIELVWHIDGIGGAQTFADIISSGGTRQLASFILPRGQDKQVSIGYQFPWKETRGRNMGFPSTGLTFNMRITAEGDARSCDLDPRTTTLAPIVPPGGPGTGGAGGAGGAGAAGDPGAPGRADAVGVSGSSNDSANAQVQNPGFGGYGGAAPPGAAAWTPNSTTVDPLDIALIATLAIGLALLAFAVITHHRHRKLHPHP